MKPQTEQVIETAREVDAKLKALEETRSQMRTQLRDFFGCGPNMTRAEQLRFLIEFFIFPEIN